MLRPRTLGKIVIAVLMVCFLLVALIYALKSPEPKEIYHSYRAITFAVMALAFAKIYEYFED